MVILGIKIDRMTRALMCCRHLCRMLSPSFSICICNALLPRSRFKCEFSLILKRIFHQWHLSLFHYFWTPSPCHNFYLKGLSSFFSESLNPLSLNRDVIYRRHHCGINIIKQSESSDIMVTINDKGWKRWSAKVSRDFFQK